MVLTYSNNSSCFYYVDIIQAVNSYVYSNIEGKGDWSDDGIKLHDEKGDQVFCLSDHLTSFVAFASEPVSCIY